MQRFTFFLVMTLVLLFSTPMAIAQGPWSEDQRAVLATMDRLSDTTAPDGLGTAAYAAILHEDFSRWTTGSSLINGKKKWVEGMGEWFGDGWRVVDRNQVVVDVTMARFLAFTRRIVEETYLGPDGETSTSKSALVETWVLENDVWYLLRVNVDVIESSAQVSKNPELDTEVPMQPSVLLPPPLARVLTDYEAAWQAKDEKALAALFTEDGFVLSNGRPPVRGRSAIEERYRDSGGPLALRAWAYSTEGSVGTIIGGYARKAGEPDIGKFTLTLKKSPGGGWLIQSDMDNGNKPK